MDEHNQDLFGDYEQIIDQLNMGKRQDSKIDALQQDLTKTLLIVEAIVGGVLFRSNAFNKEEA